MNNWNNILLWIAIVVLFFLVLRPRVSKYEGSNTIFDLNELSWIPNELKTKLKDDINDQIVPLMKTMMDTFWSSLSTDDKTRIFSDIDSQIEKAKTYIQNHPPNKENFTNVGSSFTNTFIVGTTCQAN